MKRCCTFAVVGILCFMLAACQPGAAGLSDQDDAAIRKHDADWTRMVSVDKPDWDAAVNSYYAEDAKVLVPGAPPVEGRQAIKAMFSQGPPLKEFKWEVVSLEGRGDLAYVHGNYTMTMAVPGSNATITDKGKCIEVYKKQADGNWQVIRDIWNSDKGGLAVPPGSIKPDAGTELKQMDWFVGQWKIEGEAKASPVGPAGKFSVTMNCQWFPGGGQVVCSSEGSGPAGPYQELSVYGYDPETKGYTFYDMDNTGFMGSGKGVFQGGIWSYTVDTKAGGKPLKVRTTLFDTSASACSWKNEFSLAGTPWAVFGEGKANKVQ